MKRLVVVAACAALAVVAAACGVGEDGELQRIDGDDLFGLDETTTTSTSTTTTTTLPPESTVSPPPSAATSTTIAAEPVELYFLDGNRLAYVFVNLTRGPSALRVLRALEAGPPPGRVGIGLQTVIPEELVATVEESGAGFATVDLDGATFEAIETIDQRLAFAQIVLTLTRRPGIGQVQFTVDGVPLAVPGKDNVQLEAGDLVTFEDYESLLREREAATTVPASDPDPSTTISEPASAPTTSTT